MSSLRGLTHILTCEEVVPTPFTLVVPAEGPPEILSSFVLIAGEEEGLCGGLEMDMRAGSTAEDDVEMTLLVTNNTHYSWHGTVQLRLQDLQVPVDISKIDPGETGSDSVNVKLREGSHEIEGSLLIGP
jgi:hypothetical protein